MMRWPWSKPEKRSAGGSYSDSVLAYLEAAASAEVADISSTAAVEAAAGLLSRSFSCAAIEAPGWARDAVNPVWLAQVGRSLVREGQSLSVLDMDAQGAIDLTPAASWNFEAIGTPGAERERDWQCRVTTFGPSSSHTRMLPRDRLVFVRWGTSPGTRYRGQGPLSWAHTSARLQGEAERSLADEAQGPIAQLLPVPEAAGATGADGEEVDPLAVLNAQIAKQRGKVMTVETMAAGFGEGRSAAPAGDWRQSRLGPMPPDAMVSLADAAFNRMLAACGTPPALFDDSDGTAQRESFRRYLHATVAPLGRVLAHELTLRLETDVRLNFDALFAADLSGRARAFQSMVGGGMDPAKAAGLAGLMESS